MKGVLCVCGGVGVSGTQKLCVPEMAPRKSPFSKLQGVGGEGDAQRAGGGNTHAKTVLRSRSGQVGGQRSAQSTIPAVPLGALHTRRVSTDRTPSGQAPSGCGTHALRVVGKAAPPIETPRLLADVHMPTQRRRVRRSRRVRTCCVVPYLEQQRGGRRGGYLHRPHTRSSSGQKNAPLKSAWLEHGTALDQRTGASFSKPSAPRPPHRSDGLRGSGTSAPVSSGEGGGDDRGQKTCRRANRNRGTDSRRLRRRRKSRVARNWAQRNPQRRASGNGGGCSGAGPAGEARLRMTSPWPLPPSGPRLSVRTEAVAPPPPPLTLMVRWFDGWKSVSNTRDDAL